MFQNTEISLVVLGEAMILIIGRLDLPWSQPSAFAWCGVLLVLPKSPYHGAG